MGSEPRRRNLLGCSFGFIALAFVGCTTYQGYPDYPVNTTEAVRNYLPYFTDNVLQTIASKTVEADRVEYRDEVINAQLLVFDRTYDDFIKSLGIEKNTEEIATDAATIGLAGAGSLMTPATTKSILAAVSGGITGVKGSVDKNLFYQKTIEVVISEMDAQRAIALAAIRKGQTTDTTHYSISAALVDLNSYYRAGSLENAINALSQTAGTQAAQAKSEVAASLTVKFGQDANTSLIRKYWKPDGTTVDSADQTKLNASIAKFDQTTPDIVSVIDGGDTYKDLRAKVVKDLALK
jgi:hypothetical protein